MEPADHEEAKDCVAVDQVEAAVDLTSASTAVHDGNMKLPSLSEQIVYTDKEAKQVKRKLDFVLLPLLFGCYVISVSRTSASVIHRS